MTERDLYQYIDRRRELSRARERLREFECAVYQPSSPMLSHLPVTHDDDFNKLPKIADLLGELRRAVDRAVEAVEEAAGMLDYVEERLDRDTEREFLLYRYRLGLTLSEIVGRTHRSRSSLYNDRRGILDVIGEITYIA